MIASRAPLPEAARNAVPGTRMQSAGPLTVFLSGAAHRLPPRRLRRRDRGRRDRDLRAGSRSPGSARSRARFRSKTATVASGAGRRVRGHRAAPRRSRRRRHARDPRASILSRQRLGARRRRQARRRLEAPRRDAADRSSRTAGSPRPRWRISTATAGRTSPSCARRTARASCRSGAWTNGALALKHEAAGYTNHVLGSSDDRHRRRRRSRRRRAPGARSCRPSTARRSRCSPSRAASRSCGASPSRPAAGRGLAALGRRQGRPHPGRRWRTGGSRWCGLERDGPSEIRLYPTRPFLAASVAVFRDGRVLLAARARPPMDASYSLPGGLVEPGETLAEAALRELHEEIGRRGRPPRLRRAGRDRSSATTTGASRHHFVICAHAARWRAGEPRIGAEATDVRWVREDEIAGPVRLDDARTSRASCARPSPCIEALPA